MEFLEKDCRVKIPVAAKQYMDAENARRKGTDDLRVLPITLIVEAILRSGIAYGGWEEVAQRLAAERYVPLTLRGRQPKKKPS